VKKNSQEETCTLDIISHSSTQTQRLGNRLGSLLRGGELLLLDGRLGMGKTTFTQGLAQGLGIHEVISSPTFTLLKEYGGQPHTIAEPGQPGRQKASWQVSLPLYHFDLYRLDDPEEMLDLGFEDYFYGSGVCVVEWADKADKFWPAERLRIQMKMLSETKRGLLFVATGAHYCELLKLFQKNAYATVSS
jgi:tRNA threonylcarbamoyladenosine biosynthesis protein TsaE